MDIVHNPAALVPDPRQGKGLAGIVALPPRLGTKSVGDRIGCRFAEARGESGALSYSAQDTFAGIGFEEFGGDLPHGGRVTGGGVVADLAVIPMMVTSST